MAEILPRERALIRAVGKTLNAQLDEAADALRALRLRVEALESRSIADAYKGVYDAEAGYRRGEMFSHGGALWLALNDAEPGERPGKSAAFRLILKSGSTL